MEKLKHLNSDERKNRIIISKEVTEKNFLLKKIKKDGLNQLIDSGLFSKNEIEYILFNLNNLSNISKYNYFQFSEEVKKFK